MFKAKSRKINNEKIIAIINTHLLNYCVLIHNLIWIMFYEAYWCDVNEKWFGCDRTPCARISSPGRRRITNRSIKDRTIVLGPILSCYYSLRLHTRDWAENWPKRSCTIDWGKNNNKSYGVNKKKKKNMLTEYNTGN